MSAQKKLKSPQFLVTVEGGLKPREAREAVEAALATLGEDTPTKVKQLTAASVRKLSEQWS